MTYLANLTTGAQSTIKLLAYDLGAATTLDLLGQGKTAFDGGATAGAIANALFGNANVQSAYPLLSPAATDTAFVTTLINNIVGAVTSATMAATKAGWVTSGIAALPSYANRGTFAAALNAWFDAQTPATGTDLALVQAGLANRMEVAAWYAQQPNGATFTSMNQITNVVSTVTDSAATVTAVETGTIGATSFSLTTGIDTITGASGGNSIFNGVISATAANSTLNALDSITGRGTGNVLNVADQTVGASTIPTITVSGVQTANIQSTGGETVNASGWTGLTALNLTASTGADAVTAAGTTAVTVTDTLASAAAAAAANNTTVNGGSSVTVTATGSNTGAAGIIGDLIVGTTTAPTGAVSVTATETISNAGASGYVTVKGGTTQTVTSTVTANTGAAVTANAGAATAGAGVASLITASGATGAVVINDNTVIADAAAHAITGDAVNASGGSSIVITETITGSTAANAAALASGVDGAVNVTSTTATSVTVNQTVATAKAATAAAGASGGVTTAGGSGFSSSTTPVVAAVAAAPGVLGVTAGVVQIGGASIAAQTLANASTTLTSATLASYGALSFVNSTVLNSLTLSGTGGGLTIDNLGTPAITTLALNLNGLTDTTGITETGVTTLNVTTGGTAKSTLAAFTDASLTTLNVAGTQTLVLTTPNASLTTIAVSGAAGFNGSIAGVTASGTGLAFTTTSSGTITTTLHANGLDTFTGSTGQDVITITADQTKLVQAGSATNNELILGGTSALIVAGAAHTVGMVKGFTTLGINNAAVDGTYNVALLTNDSINAIDVISGTGTTATFANVARNTSLSLDATDVTAAAFVYQSIDAQSATGNDTVTLTLGTAATAGIVIGTGTVASGAVTAQGADTGATAALSSLVMEDANQVGIATLNVVSNGTAVNAITALCDSGLANLNVSGTTGLAIGALNEGVTAGTSATAATSFTINNTSGGAVNIATFTDSALGSLTFTGTGNSTIGTLAGVTGHVVQIANTGTGTATVTTFAADVNLTSLTLSGSVALNADNPGVGLPAAAAATGATTGVTVAAGTDNAHINLNLTGAAASATDTITVGNGNDYITDGSTAGTVNVTVGTGANYIDLHGAGSATYSAAVTLGTHTGVDTVLVSALGYAATGQNTVITGAVAGDKIGIADAAAVAAVTVTAAQQTAISALSTVAAAVAYVDTAAVMGATLHETAVFQYGGNTYLLESAAGGTANAGTMAAANTLVELVGLHSITAAPVAGVFTLAS